MLKSRTVSAERIHLASFSTRPCRRSHTQSPDREARSASPIGARRLAAAQLSLTATRALQLSTERLLWCSLGAASQQSGRSIAKASVARAAHTPTRIAPSQRSRPALAPATVPHTPNGDIDHRLAKPCPACPQGQSSDNQRCQPVFTSLSLATVPLLYQQKPRSTAPSPERGHTCPIGSLFVRLCSTRFRLRFTNSLPTRSSLTLPWIVVNFDVAGLHETRGTTLNTLDSKPNFDGFVIPQHIDGLRRPLISVPRRPPAGVLRHNDYNDDGWLITGASACSTSVSGHEP